MTPRKFVGSRLVGSRAEGVCLVVFTACCWGMTWPQSKFLLSMLPPFSMRASCGIAGSAFAFLVAAARRERLIPPPDQWLWLVVFAMLNYGLFIVLTTQALVWLTASEAVVITYTLPIWASILAWPMLGERLTVKRILAILFGCGGVALMVGIDFASSGVAQANWGKLPGAAMGLAAAWLFGLGTVVAKKHPLRMPPATSVAWQGSIGTIPVLVLSLWEHPVWSDVSPYGWAAVGYISTLPLTIAYLAWFRALRLVPASTAATTVLISPMVGVIGSALLLGETLGPRQVIALAMTLTGVALAARG
jgi:probable blue pigment (indigoidine) exporter